MGQHFMLLLSIYVLYSNVSYINPVSCLVEIKLFQIISKLFKIKTLMFEDLIALQIRKCMHRVKKHHYTTCASHLPSLHHVCITLTSITTPHVYHISEHHYTTCVSHQRASLHYVCITLAIITVPRVHLHQGASLHHLCILLHA